MLEGTCIVENTAAIIANFYANYSPIAGCPPLDSLSDALIQAFGLAEPGREPYWRYRGATDSGFMHRFKAPAAKDGGVLQIVLNASGSPTEAWERQFERLRGALAASVVDGDSIWGYSLIFQLDVRATQYVAVGPPITLVPTIQCAKPLAVSEEPGGRICLLATPTGQGVDAKAVYLAECCEDHPDWAAQVFVGPSAAFLAADLVAHKGYHQLRQWHQDEFQTDYRNRLNEMTEVTHRLVLDPAGSRQMLRVLERLSRTHELMMVTLHHLELLRISMDRQLYNLNWWLKEVPGRRLWEYHQSVLSNARAELSALIEEGREVREAGGQALTLVSARLQAAHEHRQARVTNLLAAIGVLLAAPEILDRGVTFALLNRIGLLSASRAGDSLLLALCQGVLVLLVGGAALGVSSLVRYVSKRRFSEI